MTTAVVPVVPHVTLEVVCVLVHGIVHIVALYGLPDEPVIGVLRQLVPDDTVGTVDYQKQCERV